MSHNQESGDRLSLRNRGPDPGEILASLPSPSLMGDTQHVTSSTCQGQTGHLIYSHQQ